MPRRASRTRRFDAFVPQSVVTCHKTATGTLSNKLSTPRPRGLSARVDAEYGSVGAEGGNVQRTFHTPDGRLLAVEDRGDRGDPAGWPVLVA